MNLVNFNVIVFGINGVGEIQKIINMNIVWDVTTSNHFIGNHFGVD